MLHINATNVNDAFRDLCRKFSKRDSDFGFVEMDSRNGPVIRHRTPGCITYNNPLQKVLYNQARNCNPFFHVFESMWMLAGRNDLAPLTFFISDFGKYSDNGQTLHGAYGYRWRKYFGYDQLDWIIEELQDNPESRRCVLQMWDGGRTREDAYCDRCGTSLSAPEEPEAVEGTGDLYVATHGGKDVPCNMACVFEICDNKLNMTVFNRSNDCILGMLGANAVHFAFLQEYMAACIGVEVGQYRQISSNMHVYLSNCKFGSWLADPFLNVPYPSRDLLIPLLRNSSKEIFDREVQSFIDQPERDYQSTFLSAVAGPMYRAYKAHKERDYDKALDICQEIRSADWSFVSKLWMENRRASYQKQS